MTTKQQLVIIGVAFLFGVGVGSAGEPETRVETETVTETREVTPQSCKTALAIDNEIFSRMGGALGSFDYQEIDDAANYIESVTDRRNKNVNECLNKRGV